ncbi:ethylbenzene dehydrogenase-related protein [Shewanella woodyi]|uniref:Cytochrome c-552/DMSO reductase-like haem-binding domain-containing protein n=1 Tax=Shewanella woodyi (strain ATCC 51908 / MS32) TaxID=392500 RepID=B1KLZ1_SHEWM|nr:ethylbenzene dehydrogenase-related protein [Shewanella woodyi]ACA88871.1 conserved hypothetical protein [Shewanella woodyi ATCC 51908]
MENPIKFKWLHLLCSLAVLVSLLTGFRIHLLNGYDTLFLLSPILPQGQLHNWHLLAGISIALLIPLYLIFGRTHANGRRSRAGRYHRNVHRLAYLFIPATLITGSMLWLGESDLTWRQWHFYSVLGLLIYILLHGYIYFLQLGKTLLSALFSRQMLTLNASLFIALFGLAVTAIWALTSNLAPHKLTALNINPQTHIDIDGKALEPFWKQAPKITLITDGGANFVDGQTPVSIQVAANETESYFLFRWRDTTHSLEHLPLEKQQSRWWVLQQGFHRFDEQKFYEDKFAVMLSSSCGQGGDGTVHLGPKPLADKPANWHGKGYHASTDGRVRDIWHWKAVRTNDMFQADDNAFTPPLASRSGERRYTAGYHADGKESGAYVANWSWYSKQSVEPKRLPLHENTSKHLLAWFDSEPYQANKDNYPEGARLPSTLYRSNRFEGDRADVRARAVWHQGFWTLELARKHDTGSELDVKLTTGTCVWVAAFDSAQIAHTRHQRPIKLNYLSR